jgi:hypothetical protein
LLQRQLFPKFNPSPFNQSNSHMKSFKSFLALCLVAAALAPSATHASHNMGPELTYKQTGTNTFKATLTVYRACGGSSPASSYVLSKGACGGNVTVSRVSITDVTPICPTAQSKCSNGSATYGWESHVYEGTFTLSTSCSSTVLSFSDCCRESGIGNLSNSGTQNLWVSTLVTNLTGNGGSHWSNPPMFTATVNKPASFNAGGIDPDGDQLVYSLTSCKTGATSNVTYASGYSGTNPLSTSGGMSINSATGQITFTPNAVMSGVVCVKAEEYRGGVKIGEITRDIVVNVISGSNSQPTVGSVNGGGSYAATVTAGSNLTFTSTGGDPNGQGVTLSWNSGISGASMSFSGNGGTAPVATFSWTPTAPGTYYFVLNAKDNNCDLNGVTQQAFTVNVNAAKSSPFASGNASISCSPQPFSTAFSLSGLLPEASGEVSIEVLDLSGRRVSQHVTTATQGEFSLVMDGSALAPGLYFAVARSGDLQAVTRLLKQ